MKMKDFKYILFILSIVPVIMLTGSRQCFAQDPQLSQFYSIPTYLGPSFAGAINGSRAVLNFRDQWPGMNKAYITYSLSYDMNLPKYKSGVGLLVLRDQAGELKFSRNYIGAQYAYQIAFGKKWVFRPGLTFYYLRSHYDASEVTFGHQIDTETGDISGNTRVEILNDTKNTFDFSTSALIYRDNFWTGVTVDHLIRPNESLLSERKSRIPMKFTAYSGMKFNLTPPGLIHRKEKSVTIAYFYKKQSNFSQFDIGGYWTREPLTFGLWYRGLPIRKVELDAESDNFKVINHDALIFLVGVKLEQIQLSYNYDITISKIHVNSHGAHEISITYNMPYREPKKKIKPLPCPWF